jgi:integrase
MLHPCVGEHWQPLVEFLVASGARFGEATALTPGDVDLAKHELQSMEDTSKVQIPRSEDHLSPRRIGHFGL